jgi:hypothetical protein
MQHRYYRRVSNPADRDQDAIYTALLDLPIAPYPGLKLAFADALIDIASVYVNMESNQLLIELAPDHSAFRRTTFDKVCQKMEKLGFVPIDDELLKQFKRGDIPPTT